MATRSVTVLTPHGRRYNVKTEPDMPLLSILETACRKYNFAPDGYDLTHHNRLLDLSIMFRFSGLPNNALLEMVEVRRPRTEADVTILLQLEDGTRQTGTFKPPDSLLEVLQRLCPERAQTGSAHTLMVYMRREVYWDQMAATTLKSLGLTKGRAILRVMERKPEAANTQANVSGPLPTPVSAVAPDEAATGSRSKIQDVPSTSETESKPSEAPQQRKETQSEDAPKESEATKPKEVAASQLDTSDNQSPALEQPAETSQTASPTDACPGKKQKTDAALPRADTPPSSASRAPEPPNAQIVIVGERQAVLYHASTAERELIDPDDSFFELSVQEVLHMYTQLQARATALEDAALMLRSMRELERNQSLLRSMARYKQAVVRVKFPDRHILQAVFEMYETVAHVEEFVRGFLADRTSPFYLYTTPPKVVLKSDVSLLDAGCFPLVLLHFGTTQASQMACFEREEAAADSATSSVLRPELLGQLSNATGAAVVAARAKRGSPPAGPPAADGKEEGSGSGTDPAVAAAAATADAASEQEQDEAAAGPSTRIPNRNFRQSTLANPAGVTSREAMILKFLKK